MMQKLCIIVAIIIISYSVSIAQPLWQVKNSGVNRELTDVCFVDQNNGWISGWTETMLHTTDGGETWSPQNILPNNAYFSVFFTDLLNGWASGYGGKIVHTTDGGQTWVDQASPTNTDLYDIHFVNSNSGWIAGGDAGSFPSYISHRYILSTSNGGVTWNTQYGQAYKSLLKSIHFVDQNNGYATGESGIILKTTDGGTNWLEQSVISSFHFYDIFFANNTTGWVIGEYLGVPHYAAIFKTTDGGINWNETSLGIDESLSGIYFTDIMHGWAVGGDSNNDGIMYYTSDSGINWTLQNIPSVNFLYRVFFFDENHGWSSGHLGTIIATDNSVPVELTSFNATTNDNNVNLSWQTATEINNSGFAIERRNFVTSNQQNEWKRIEFLKGHGTTTEENNYSFVDENLTTGKYQYRLKQIDYDGSFEYSEIAFVEIFKPEKFSLKQNYPNPFNPSTTIEYSIPESGKVKLIIYNSLGEKVTTLVNNFKEAGTHKVNFDARDLASSIYLYKIDSGNYSSIKKMILLR